MLEHDPCGGPTSYAPPYPGLLERRDQELAPDGQSCHSQEHAMAEVVEVLPRRSSFSETRHQLIDTLLDLLFVRSRLISCKELFAST